MVKKLLKKQVYNIVQIPKNAVQYSLGIILYLITFKEFLPIHAIIGLFSFVIAYQSVYFFNDLMDLKEDQKDKFKAKIKALPQKAYSIETAISGVLFFSVFGIAISLMLNKVFTILLITILLLNFLYSTNLVRLKNSKFRIITMIIIEVIKFSIGWFALTSSPHNLPILIIIALSSFYVTGYIFYKKFENLDDHLKEKSFMNLVFLSIFLFLASIYIYDFRIQLALIVLTLVIWLKINDKIINHKSKYKKFINLARDSIIISVISAIILLTYLFNDKIFSILSSLI